jgi:hypothetical protein
VLVLTWAVQVQLGLHCWGLVLHFRDLGLGLVVWEQAEHLCLVEQAEQVGQEVVVLALVALVVQVLHCCLHHCHLCYCCLWCCCHWCCWCCCCCWQRCCYCHLHEL